MKRNLQIIGGVVAVLVGLGFIMPAVALWRTQGSLPTMSVALLLLGVSLSLGAAGPSSPARGSRGVDGRRGRRGFAGWRWPKTAITA